MAVAMKRSWCRSLKLLASVVVALKRTDNFVVLSFVGGTKPNVVAAVEW